MVWRNAAATERGQHVDSQGHRAWCYCCAIHWKCERHSTRPGVNTNEVQGNTRTARTGLAAGFMSRNSRSARLHPTMHVELNRTRLPMYLLAKLWRSLARRSKGVDGHRGDCASFDPTLVSHAPRPLITMSPSTLHNSAPKNGGTCPQSIRTNECRSSHLHLTHVFIRSR